MMEGELSVCVFGGGSGVGVVGDVFVVFCVGDW